MTSKSNLVEVFNNKNLKKILSVKDMEPGKEYPIIGCSRMKTPYGNSVVVELIDNIIYLPKRFNFLDDNAIKHLGDNTFSISKTPINEDSNNLLYRLEINERLHSNNFYAPYM